MKFYEIDGTIKDATHTYKIIGERRHDNCLSHFQPKMDYLVQREDGVERWVQGSTIDSFEYFPPEQN
jgi:hypothetical protein